MRAPKQADGTRPSLGTYATREEADAILATARAISVVGTRDGTPKFALYARGVLEQRERDGFRSAKKDLRRFTFHLEKSSIAELTLDKITSLHIIQLGRELTHKIASDLRGKRKLSHRTVKRVVTLVSVVFSEAMEQSLVALNPCTGVKIRKRKEEGTDDEWTYLTPEEQERLRNCDGIPYEDRVIIRCAMGSGIRAGELAFNYLRDLHLDGPEPYLTVRFGSREGGVDLPPKNGTVRRVPLFGDGLAAFREWLEIRKTYMRRVAGARHEVRRDEGLIFPTVTGCRRQPGHLLGNGWKEPSHPRATAQRTDEKGILRGGWVDLMAHYFHLAGVADRPWLDWHCLRHTCATSLLEGWWGAPWALEEVKEQLGHKDIKVTQRYAHHAGTRLRAAAARMATTHPDTYDELGVLMPRDVSPAEVTRYVTAREAARAALVTTGIRSTDPARLTA